MLRKIIAVIFVLFITNRIVAQGTFYNLNTIQRIEITFTQTNWDHMLDTAANGSQGYIMAKKVKINNTEFDSVGVKYKGNSSYNANQIKNPFHIELDTYKDRSRRRPADWPAYRTRRCKGTSFLFLLWLTGAVNTDHSRWVTRPGSTDLSPTTSKADPSL